MNRMFASKQDPFFLMLLLCLGVSAMPVRAETPLSLAVSETLTYDSNIIKDNKRKYTDLKSNTGVVLGFDKEYGRQSYSASFLAVAERFKKSSEYDNDGYKINLAISSGIASNGLVSLRVDRLSQLQDFADQGLTRYAETVESTNASLSGTYGLYGRWSVNMTGNAGEARYKRNDFYDKDYTGLRVGLRYSPTDLLYFDGGAKRLKLSSDKLPLSLFGAVGEDVDRTDIDLRAHWVVTGFSSLDAQIAWSKEDHLPDERRSFKGLTGRVNWQYTPRGKVSYNLSLERDTNNEGGFSNITFDSISTGTSFGRAQDRLTTGGTFSANWQATAKISASASLAYRRLQESSIITTVDQIIPVSTSGNYRSIAFGLKYVPMRALAFNCNLEVYNRSATVLATPYSGQALTCSAAFSID